MSNGNDCELQTDKAKDFIRRSIIDLKDEFDEVAEKINDDGKGELNDYCEDLFHLINNRKEELGIIPEADQDE